MINKNEAHTILSRALKYSKADKTIVYLTGGKFALTRFAENYIHQNVIQKDYKVKVISIVGDKIGVAEENIFNDDKMKNIVDASYEIAKNLTKGCNIPEFANSNEIIDSSHYYDKTINFSREAAAKRVMNVIEYVKKNKCIAAGTFQNGDEINSILTSEGQFCYQIDTNSAFTLTVMNNLQTGYAQCFSSNIDNLNEMVEVEKAVKNAIIDIPLVDIKPGKYDVILSEDCVSEFIMFLSYMGFNGKKYLNKQSFMNNNIGKKIFSDKLTIIDDCSDKNVYGLQFDHEGYKRNSVNLVEKGVASNIVTDSTTSKKLNLDNTGHGLPLPSTFGPVAVNLKMLPGNSKLEDMIKNTKKGIFINKLHYNNIVEPLSIALTGLTIDGTFIIENGEFIGRTKTLRYNESLLSVLSRIEQVSNKCKLSGEGGWNIYNPALKIKDFNITHQV